MPAGALEDCLFNSGKLAAALLPQLVTVLVRVPWPVKWVSNQNHLGLLGAAAPHRLLGNKKPQVRGC